MENAEIRREIACSFTGHRPERLPGGYAAWDSPASPLRPWIRRAVEEAAADGYRDFICGMALGADTLAAEEVLGLRERLEGIRLIAAVPCPEQADRWRQPDRMRYRRLLRLADWMYTASPVYTPYAMHLRNRWMVAITGSLTDFSASNLMLVVAAGLGIAVPLVLAWFAFRWI